MASLFAARWAKLVRLQFSAPIRKDRPRLSFWCANVLKMHDGAKAAGEFQRLLDHRGAAGFASEYPLARLNLARAYAMQGDTAKAKITYQDFFAAWKDADPDVPILKTARAEYAMLK
jgi:tetratricopeptide (TPR) repeat protein